MTGTTEIKLHSILCERVALKVPFKCRSHEISYVCQSDMNEYFIIKFSSYVADSVLQPYAKFQIDIPVLSCPIGTLKIYGNITAQKSS